MNRRRVLMCTAAMVWASCATGAGLLSGPFSPLPGTDQAKFYAANTAAIENFAHETRIGETGKRLTAIETLANTYRDPALNLATELINDEDALVAADSARLLADTLAMTGSVAVAARMYGLGTPAKQRFDAAIASLRGAVDDKRVVVREVAARTLAGLGDRLSLDLIERCVQEGWFPALEAIDYFGVAPRELGSEYIQKYLDSGPTEARVAAVGYLATVPSYQERIREMVLENPDVDDAVRAKAAGVLSRYDRGFPTYAVEILGRPELPAAVSQEVIHAYVAHALEVKIRDAGDWPRWVRTVDNALVKYPHQQPLMIIKAGLTNGEQ